MAAQITEAMQKLDAMISDAAAQQPQQQQNGSAAAAAAPAGGDGVASIRAELTNLFTASIAAAMPAAAGEVAAVFQCNNPQNGDYQCNNAMALFGKLKGKVRCQAAPRGGGAQQQGVVTACGGLVCVCGWRGCEGEPERLPSQAAGNRPAEVGSLVGSACFEMGRLRASGVCCERCRCAHSPPLLLVWIHPASSPAALHVHACAPLNVHNIKHA